MRNESFLDMLHFTGVGSKQTYLKVETLNRRFGIGLQAGATAPTILTDHGIYSIKHENEKNWAFSIVV